MDTVLRAIDRGEALRYLGIRGGEPDAQLLADLSRCEALLLQAARPRTVWRLFDLLPDGRLGGTDYRPGGRDLRAFLGESGRVVLLAATLGAGVEALMRRACVRSMADAVLLDALGSAAIEQVCDKLCAELAERFAPQRLTGRFSPGYGDLPLSEQEAVFRVLDVNRAIGVSLTEGGLMVPQKSVTAFVGVTLSPPAEQERGCENCAQAGRCAYRREGKSCGK